MDLASYLVFSIAGICIGGVLGLMFMQAAWKSRDSIIWGVFPIK